MPTNASWNNCRVLNVVLVRAVRAGVHGVLQDEKTMRALRGTGLRLAQPFVCFGDNVIDHCLHIVCAFPNC